MISDIDDDLELIEIGFCAKSHGIRGGLVFTFFNEESTALDVKSKVFLIPQNKKSHLAINGEKHEIDKISYGNKVIVYLNGVTDKTRADEMIPFIIKISKHDFPKLSSDEFYVADLIGLSVYDFRSKERIGHIKDYYENGAQIVFIITINSLDVEIPFVDAFFPHVDLDKKEVMVILPEFVE